MLFRSIGTNNLSMPRANSFNLTANLTDKRGAKPARKTLEFLIDGKSVGNATTNLRGIATLTVTDGQKYAPGPHTIRVNFAGDRLLKSSSQKAILTILKADTSIATKSLTIAPGEIKYLTATLTQKSNGNVMTGKLVKFRVDKKVVGTAVTDGTGVASYSYNIKESQSVGKHTLTAQFEGDSEQGASSADATLTVAQAKSQSVTVDVSGKQGETVKLTATLTRTTDQAGLREREIRFLVDGKEVGKVKSDKSGKAVLSYVIPSSMSKGKHTLKVMFDGDSFYTSSDNSKTLTVN